MTRDEKQVEFMNKNRLKIISECIKYKNETGYVKVLVNENFEMISLKFVTEEFNKGEFTNALNTPEKNNILTGDLVDVYFSILWLDTKTKWQVKEVVSQDYHHLAN